MIGLQRRHLIIGMSEGHQQTQTDAVSRLAGLVASPGSDRTTNLDLNRIYLAGLVASPGSQ